MWPMILLPSLILPPEASSTFCIILPVTIWPGLHADAEMVAFKRTGNMVPLGMTIVPLSALAGWTASVVKRSIKRSRQTAFPKVWSFSPRFHDYLLNGRVSYAPSRALDILLVKSPMNRCAYWLTRKSMPAPRGKLNWPFSEIKIITPRGCVLPACVTRICGRS